MTKLQRQPLGNRNGIALISVLVLIVLVTVLIIGFLVRASYEGISSTNYRATSTTRVLADTAVNLVQAEINEASSWKDTAWASQPGAIRVFDNNGSLIRFYRLYSAPSLASQVSQGEMLGILQNDLPSNDWQDQPALWVDLNAPVKVTGLTDSSGNKSADYLIFPVIDPRDPNNLGNDPVNAPQANLVDTGSSGMPGFSINQAQNPADTNRFPLQPLPMPVRWLYVLENGQIVAPQAAVSGSSTKVTVNGASASNPIIGRIAFWTDDETSKVNVNTAAGSFSVRGAPTQSERPAPWDTPRFKSWDDYKIFAQAQPVKGEYQRYPGHPATTDLYHIFHALGIPTTGFPQMAGSNYANGSTKQPTTTGAQTSFFQLLPRYDDAYSSQGGTADTTAAASGGAVTTTGTKSYRLYTSIGELMFGTGTTASQRSANWTLAGGAQDTEMRQRIESGKFFLTAHSRAPEETLFGTPRVTIWPVDTDASKITPYDNLITFCSTTGTGNNNYKYYFQRHDPNGAPTGPGESSPDYQNIPRNQQLYSYLQTLTSQNIPGYGGNFKAKYNYQGGLERDQILTEIVDYIRCTNLFDHSTASTTYGFTGIGVNNQGNGQVTPLVIRTNGNVTRGLGRVLTLSEIGVLLICTAEGSTQPHNTVTASGSPKNSNVTGYQPPDSLGASLVSPVVGSANDPAYVSNLPVAQYLRDTSGNIIGITNNPSITTTPGAVVITVAGSAGSIPSGCSPFPANPTLTTTGLYTTDSNSLAALNPGDKRVQAALLFETACPMQGYDLLDTRAGINVSNLSNLFINGVTPFSSVSGTMPFSTSTGRFNNFSSYGGMGSFRFPLMANNVTDSSNASYNNRYNGWSGILPPDPIRGTAKTKGVAYRYISNPFTVAAGTGNIPLSGSFDVALYSTAGSTSNTYQTFNAQFPSTNVPIPDLAHNGLPYSNSSTGAKYTSPAAFWWGFDYRISLDTVNYAPAYSLGTTNEAQNWGAVIRGDVNYAGTWSYSTNSSWPVPTVTSPTPYSDVVRSIVAKDGDYRTSSALSAVNVSATGGFTTSPNYDNSGVKLANLFRDMGGYSGANAGSDSRSTLIVGGTYARGFLPKIPEQSNLSISGTDILSSWDWDNGLPSEPDGCYANKPDEGNNYVSGNSTPYYNSESINVNLASRTNYFTANRIIPSPVMFGSLPTGVMEGITWRTLLFRPQLNRPTYANPPGPKDYLLLDLFHMPVVEPYAISEPFSTAGKINMNYQIVPFTYITRSTGVRAVIDSELVARIHKNSAQLAPFSTNTAYKGSPQFGGGVFAPTNSGNAVPARLPINLSDVNGALRQFKQKFDNGEIFRSAAEICDIYLPPIDPESPSKYSNWTSDTAADQAWYGDDFALVGDNVRERPYGDIYPRLTTKSNTYTVHFYVQSLKNPSSDPAQWDESRGAVTGEYRGSATIERYIDPSNPQIPDYTTGDPSSWTPLDDYYQWRVIANNSFSP